MKADFIITYYLVRSRKDKSGAMPVYLRSAQNSAKQISYNTGVKLLSDQWNKRKREPKNKPAVLIELEGKLKSTYRDLMQQGYEPDLTMLLKHLNDRRKPGHLGIMAWCDDYLKGAYSEGQKKSVRTLKSNIEGFNKFLTFDKLTKPRLKTFFEYLTEKGVANNSQYKRLRALVNVAAHANLDLPHLVQYQLPYSTVNALKARLTWPEVRAVMDTPTASQIESIAKDAFLLACFSGLRISDLLTLNRGEIHNYHYERVQTKTKRPVLVTVHKYNEDIFRRYIDKGVPYTRQRLSDALKLVLQRAGIDKKITKIQAVGYGHKETAAEKWEEISFHSGRRFYSRLLNDLGLGNEIARDELGHSFKSITDLYAGSPDHSYRVARVRKAMEGMEKTLEELAIMKVA